KEKVHLLSEEIARLATRPLTFMEVCGTHTMAIARHGIKSLLPPAISIVSGPGCPVCVTSATDIERAITLGDTPGVLVATFGDMIKVPGEKRTLGSATNVKVIYSPLDALELARKSPHLQVVLLGIGFETTAPLMAAAVLQARREALPNFSTLSMHKMVPQALSLLLSDENSALSGFILPGHVSAITGRKYYNFLEGSAVSSVIAGFEPLDIMESLYRLVQACMAHDCRPINNYPRIVKEEGNTKAMETLFRVFEPCDTSWRGIGTIPLSGLALKEEFAQFDASARFDLPTREIPEPKGCLCGAILMGKALPDSCRHFGTACTPSFPIGPCMVSTEGTCAAWFKYH
ncbi:hydrogenase formation protein HypD, partial [Myxococcota bacterium]|nr:hydrogenase formation protein HypD [Myxococcota bacterium]